MVTIAMVEKKWGLRKAEAAAPRSHPPRKPIRGDACGGRRANRRPSERGHTCGERERRLLPGERRSTALPGKMETSVCAYASVEAHLALLQLYRHTERALLAGKSRGGGKA